MILSSQYLQVLVLILFTISTCQSSDISNEIVRQGVGSYGTELILEEMSQTANAPMSTSRDFTSPDFYGCGSCLSRLRIGDSGSLSSGAYDNSSCVWLLHTEEAEAQVNIICDNIRLPSCKGNDGQGKFPKLDNVLIISPSWDFTKSLVYCGHATDRLGGSVAHVSTCGRMAVIYRHVPRPEDSWLPKGDFHCTYHVVRAEL